MTKTKTIPTGKPSKGVSKIAAPKLLPNKEYKNHPIADSFRLLEGREFFLLKEMIKRHKLSDRPITVMIHEGKILDGRNAYRAAIEMDMVAKLTFIAYQGSNPFRDAVEWNMGRRHESKVDKAMVAVALSVGSGRGKPAKNGMNIEKSAKLVGVSKRMVINVKKVLDSKNQELIARMINGELGAEDAALSLEKKVTKKEERKDKKEKAKKKTAKEKKADKEKEKSASVDGHAKAASELKIAKESTVADKAIKILGGLGIEAHLHERHADWVSLDESSMKRLLAKIYTACRNAAEGHKMGEIITNHDTSGMIVPIDESAKPAPKIIAKKSKKKSKKK